LCKTMAELKCGRQPPSALWEAIGRALLQCSLTPRGPGCPTAEAVGGESEPQKNGLDCLSAIQATVVWDERLVSLR
jgi:metal-sulfur cluster biosynthetic enzyme